MVAEHCFDFTATKKGLGLDTYGGIRMINYLRASTKRGAAAAQSIEELLSTSSEWSKMDEHLKPVMNDDALIFGMHEGDGAFSSDEEEQETHQGGSAATRAQLEARIVALQNTVASLAAQLR